MITLEALWTERNQAHLHRILLAAFAHPGEVLDMGEALDGRRALLGVLAPLTDAATTLADPDRLLDRRDHDFLGASITDAAHAAFVVARGGTAPAADLTLARGDLLAPERGATLVLDCDRIGAGSLRIDCTGPGIAEATAFAVEGLHPAWLELRRRHCARHPLGIDLILCDERRIAALPRTTRVAPTSHVARRTPNEES